MKQESITGVNRPSDTELLRRAITYAIPQRGQGDMPRWSCVGHVFSVGSTTATSLCKEFGVDPNEYLSGSYCEECPFDPEDEEE